MKNQIAITLVLIGVIHPPLLSLAHTNWYRKKKSLMGFVTTWTWSWSWTWSWTWYLILDTWAKIHKYPIENHREMSEQDKLDKTGRNRLTTKSSYPGGSQIVALYDLPAIDLYDASSPPAASSNRPFRYDIKYDTSRVEPNHRRRWWDI